MLEWNPSAVSTVRPKIGGRRLFQPTAPPSNEAPVKRPTGKHIAALQMTKNKEDHFVRPEAEFQREGKAHFQCVPGRDLYLRSPACLVDSKAPPRNLRVRKLHPSEPSEALYVPRAEGKATQRTQLSSQGHISHMVGQQAEGPPIARGRVLSALARSTGNTILGGLSPARRCAPQSRGRPQHPADHVFLSDTSSTPVVVPATRRSTRSASPTHRSCIGQLFSGDYVEESTKRVGRCTRFRAYSPESLPRREWKPSPRHMVTQPLASSLFSPAADCLYDFKFSSTQRAPQRAPSAPCRSVPRNPIIDGSPEVRSTRKIIQSPVFKSSIVF